MEPVKTPAVDILLATCNGERFLGAQIASLLAQSRNDFRIIARDDASADRTPELLSALRARHPERVTLIRSDGRRLGPARCFGELLRHARAEYVMLCDQDDVWLKHKIALSLERMARLEARWGAHTPVLVHTDLMVTDSALNPSAGSFAAYKGLNLNACPINRLLVQNVITGCTMTMNRALGEKVGDIPAAARMHDWWIALVASIFGVVDYIDEPTVLYRQHAGNTVGAKRFSAATMRGDLRTIWRVKDDLRRTMGQARALAERHGPQMPAAIRRICREFGSLDDRSPLSRRMIVFKHRLFKHGFMRNLALLALV